MFSYSNWNPEFYIQQQVSSQKHGINLTLKTKTCKLWISLITRRPTLIFWLLIKDSLNKAFITSKIKLLAPIVTMPNTSV